jgi:hypothetical protein
LKESIAGYINRIKGASDPSGVGEIVDEIHQQVTAKQLVPDQVSLSQLYRAVDQQLAPTTVSEPARRDHQVGRFRSRVVACIHVMGGLANQSDPSLDRRPTTTPG